jgi:hypothetical protein
MEYLKKLNDKEPAIGGKSKHDSCVKEMYSCGHSCKKASSLSNLVGVIITLGMMSYLVYRFMNNPIRLSYDQIMKFAREQEVFKMFFGLLLLTHVKTLSNSLIANIVLPIIKPILPLISCNLKIKLGLFKIGIGEFISDLIVFMVNISLIFFLFSVIY